MNQEVISSSSSQGLYVVQCTSRYDFKHGQWQSVIGLFVILISSESKLLLCIWLLLKKGVLHCCNLILWWLMIMRIFFIQRDLTKKVDLTLFLMNLWSFLFQKYVQQVTFKPKKISDVTLSDRQFVSSVNKLLLSSFLVHWV